MAPSTVWTRETPWQQGCVLPTEATEYFGLTAPGSEGAEPCAVVVSHDCDLANDDLDVEPDVEVVVGRIVKTASGNFTHAKSPRTLHHCIKRDGNQVVIELVATSKRLLPKADLARFAPDPAFTWVGRDIAVLRSWLASRYNRTPFPDAFVNRMRDCKASDRISKCLGPSGSLITFVYIDLDGGELVPREPGDPYTFSVVLAFDPRPDADAAAEQADKIADQLREDLEKRLKDPMSLVLGECFAISEQAISVSRARVLQYWRLEHLSMRAQDEQLSQPAI